MLTSIQATERALRRERLRKPRRQASPKPRKVKARVPVILPMPLTADRTTPKPRAELPAHELRWVTDPRGSVVRWSDVEACYLRGYWVRTFEPGPCEEPRMHVRDDSNAQRSFAELPEDERRRVALALHGASVDGSVTLWAAELAMERSLEHRARARAAVLKFWRWARTERAHLRRELRDAPSRLRRRHLREFDRRVRIEAAELRELASPYRAPFSYAAQGREAWRIESEAWWKGWLRRATRPQLMLTATCS